MHKMSRKKGQGDFMERYLSSIAALAEIGTRLKAYRVDSSLSQEKLADKAGVSRRSLQNMESGNDVNFSTVIKVLIALKLDSNLDMLVPDPTKRPSYYLNKKPVTHKRTRVSKKTFNDSKKTFKWGDES